MTNESTLQLTMDGSHTVFSEHFKATYHSKHGAIQEAQTVFIDAALLPIAAQKSEISVLEIGLGTGLNALMTFGESLKNGFKLHYVAIEAYPLAQNIISSINYPASLGFAQSADYFDKIHIDNWNIKYLIDENINFAKYLMPFDELETRQMTEASVFLAAFDIIYFDAFAPTTQPELWTEAMFATMFAALRTGGVLTTYCAKGSVKRALRAVGFEVESLPGPIGKREMTRAWKP